MILANNIDQTTKTLLFSLILAIILVLSLLAFVGYLIVITTRKMGKGIDDQVYDVLKYKIINNKKHFKKYATKKSFRMFYKSAKISILIILVGTIVLLIRNGVTRDWSYNPFDREHFGSLFYIWDYNVEPEYKRYWIIAFPKWPIINRPHIIKEAWACYIFGPCIIVGGIWYLVCIQGLIGRGFRIEKASNSLFKKSLDGANFSKNREPEEVEKKTLPIDAKDENKKSQLFDF